MIQTGTRITAPAKFQGEQPVRRVYLLDDSRMIRAALRQVIRGAGGFEVVGEGAELGVALEEAPLLTPDIVVLDPFDDASAGQVGIARLSKGLPWSSILVATTEEERALSELHMGGNLRALVSKDGEPADLLRGLRAAGDGAWFVCPRIARRGCVRL